MAKNIKEILVIIVIALIPTLLVWTPFFLKLETFWGIPLPQNGMATVVANYDGPLYIVVAKTLYSVKNLGLFPFSLPAAYYAAHFPLFPLLIKAIAPLTGFPYSLLSVTVLSTILCLYFFHKFISAYTDKKEALWITAMFSVFPARWLIVRSIGSPEPLFLAATIAAIYFFNNKKYLLASIWGAVSVFTKSPGILIFIAFFISYLLPKINKITFAKKTKILALSDIYNIAVLFLIPVALLIVFYVFKLQLNDFFAYFHSGDNIHLMFPPFQIFNYSSVWVGTFWLEEIIFIYMFGAMGLISLIKQKDFNTAIYVGIFFISTLFIAHRDLIRYSLPIVPFVYAAFARYLATKEFKIAFIFLIFPIYLFSLAFIANNVMPISNWGPLL